VSGSAPEPTGHAGIWEVRRSVLRWTDRPDRTGASIEGVPGVPRAATLIGAALVFMAAVMPLRLVSPRHMVPIGPFLVIVAMAVSVVYGLVLILFRRMRSRLPALLGVAMLDALPVLLVAVAEHPVDFRSRTLWLLAPTVIVATYRQRALVLLQCSMAAVISCVILIAPSEVSTGSVVEGLTMVGALVMATDIVWRLGEATRAQAAQLRRSSLTDGLTGVLNRRGLLSGFGELVREAERQNSVVGVVLMDVDHFKRINDEYGHAVGDEVLRRICAVAGRAVGDRGLLARTGGEELAVVVADAPEGLAERIREQLSTGVPEPQVTVSMGVVSMAPAAIADPSRLWDLLDAADRALYRAKQDGRNRIRRGAVDLADERPRALVPAASAAVPRPTNPATGDDASLYGDGLIYFSLLALLTRFFTDVTTTSGWAAWMLLAGALLGIATGVWLLVRRPAVPTSWLLTGALAVDAVIAAAILSATTIAAAQLVLAVALIPALLVSLYLPRSLVLAHHLVVAALCVLATTWSGVPLALWLAAVLTATVTIVGSAEVMYRLRMRHDVIAASLHGWSVTDPLTGLANRRGLELAFDHFDRNRPLRILELDVDDFKSINDRLGHGTGDDALARLALTLTVVSPPGSVVARTGGDEFVIVSPAADDDAADRIRSAAGLLPVPLSVTVGSVLSAPGSDTGLWELVTLADMQLIERKQDRQRRRPG
jgi:diguanylate cyclase (GGDEF)-like protein